MGRVVDVQTEPNVFHSILALLPSRNRAGENAPLISFSLGCVMQGLVRDAPCRQSVLATTKRDDQTTDW